MRSLFGSKPARGWQRFRSELYPYEVDHPMTWSAQQLVIGESKSDNFMKTGHVYNGFTTHISIMGFRAPKPRTIEVFSEAVMTDLDQSGFVVNVGESGKTTLENGVLVLIVGMNMRVRGVDFVASYTFFQKGGYDWAFCYNTAHPENDIDDAYANMLMTFRKR